MAYGLYNLFYRGRELDFTTFKKKPDEVIGDALRVIADHVDLNQVWGDPVGNVDIEQAKSNISMFIQGMELTQVKVVDGSLEKDIDMALSYIEDFKRLKNGTYRTATKEREEAGVILAQIDFGIRRLVDRIFCYSFFEQDQGWREEQVLDLRHHFMRAAAFHFAHTESMFVFKMYQDLLNTGTAESKLDGKH